jgi:putative transposase
MKLTKGKLMETIRRKNEGWTTYQARKIAGISVRRVNQVYTQYLLTGEMPAVGRGNGRPARSTTELERSTIRIAYEKYRVSASTLQKLVLRDSGISINHNRIHRVLIELGYANKLDKVNIRKKRWIRYQRKHSLTAVHVDWHLNAESRLWVFAVIDDASRKILALLECQSPSTDASIDGMKQALAFGRIRQCISDHGSQFTDNRDGESRFAAFLEEEGIKQILCKIKHPQSNGKVEKFFHLYDLHRFSFPGKEEFLVWYNEVRPHLSLRTDELETPQMAFLRKLRAEV